MGDLLKEFEQKEGNKNTAQNLAEIESNIESSNKESLDVSSEAKQVAEEYYAEEKQNLEQMSGDGGEEGIDTSNAQQASTENENEFTLNRD